MPNPSESETVDGLSEVPPINEMALDEATEAVLKLYPHWEPSGTRLIARTAIRAYLGYGAAATLRPPREAEGRYREALVEIVSRHPDSPPGEHPAVDIARQALQEQP